LVAHRRWCPVPLLGNQEGYGLATVFWLFFLAFLALRLRPGATRPIPAEFPKKFVVDILVTVLIVVPLAWLAAEGTARLTGSGWAAGLVLFAVLFAGHAVAIFRLRRSA
jgi:hypothetical protein